MPVALTGHGGGGNCANGIAVSTEFKIGIEHCAERAMHSPEDEVVRLINADLSGGFVKVSGV